MEKKDFYGNIETPFRIITRKGITPGEEEIITEQEGKKCEVKSGGKNLTDGRREGK